MAKDGFLILGIFGSYARDENTPSSDVDILYDTDVDFFKRYGGFGSFVKLDEIKESLETWQTLFTCEFFKSFLILWKNEQEECFSVLLLSNAEGKVSHFKHLNNYC